MEGRGGGGSGWGALGALTMSIECRISRQRPRGHMTCFSGRAAVIPGSRSRHAKLTLILFI